MGGLEQEVVEDYFGPFESVERTSLGHFAYREVQVQTIEGGSSRQERIGLVVFWDVNDLKVEEEFSTMATPFCAEGVWMSRLKREQQQTAWRKRIIEVQRWKQVRGLAGAVMREARDLGTRWPKMPYLVVSRASAGGHPSGLAARREEDVAETSQDGLLEEVGSQTRV